MRRRKRLDRIYTVTAVIGCTATALAFTVGGFCLGDDHPATIAFAITGIVNLSAAMAAGRTMFYGRR